LYVLTEEDKSATERIIKGIVYPFSIYQLFFPPSFVTQITTLFHKMNVNVYWDCQASTEKHHLIDVIDLNVCFATECHLCQSCHVSLESCCGGEGI